MTEELRKKHKKWIKGFLTPILIKNPKFIACKNENVEIKSIEIKEMSLEVAFMLTICYFVKITLKIKADHSENRIQDEEKTFNVVVKIAPELEPEFYEIMEMKSLFSNEITTYESIIPSMKSLSKSPKCYYSHNKPLEAAIALSDFSEDGWRMSKSKVNLSLDHILAAVNALGHYHGEMYALKLTDIKTFNNMKNKLVGSRYREGGRTSIEWNMWMELGIRRATNSVRASKPAQSIVPESFLKRLEEVMYGAYNYRMKRMKPIEPNAIICHGDYLRNNIAFRYDSDGKAIEAMMFDFQTMCYASPMLDLTTFMANSTGWEVRNKYFSQIFNSYHSILIENFLSASKWKENDIPDYLKYENLLKEYARYLPFGLHVAASFLQTLHSDGEPVFFELPLEETLRQIFDKGGEAVDAEIRSLIVDIYHLHNKFNLTLEKL